MKLKELEMHLQDVDSFLNPKIKHEQYETPAHIAANMLYTIESSFGGICGKHVADLGSGCGMLSIGAALLDASLVVGFELDKDLVETFHQNKDNFDLQNVEMVLADVLDLKKCWNGFFDTVILNPPFGTKRNQGIDMSFLKIAIEISKNSVFSLHKSSTRDHVLKKSLDWKVHCKVIAELKYNLPSTYKFHKKANVDIQVDLIKFTHIGADQN